MALDQLKWQPQLFAVTVLFAATSIHGVRSWAASGAAGLTYCLVLGSYNSYRVFPGIGLWTLLATINLFYFVAATSWLFYWVYTIWCYPITLLVCLYQFQVVSRTMRKGLRKFLKKFHFMGDQIAYFGLPALEIDSEVDGLMVIRGVTIHISSLVIVVHGVEVGIKIADDMELALQVDKVVVSLFRSVQVGDVYANLKGGSLEMSFGEMLDHSTQTQKHPLLEKSTPMLNAASEENMDSRRSAKKMTNGKTPRPLQNAGSMAASIQKLTLDDGKALEQYNEMIKTIHRSSTINESRDLVETLMGNTPADQKDGLVSNETSKRFESIESSIAKDKRAAISSQLHNRPTIAHPPDHSIKVTTLQSLFPSFRRIVHRMPGLYRLLLNPIAYLHPVDISTVTACASGKWIQHLVYDKVFKRDADDSEITELETRILAWLTDANFIFEMADMNGTAQVPIAKGFDIKCILGVRDILAYRTQIQQTNLKQVIRLDGADATISVPSMLLPHHEHWLPKEPSRQIVQERERDVNQADGVPQAVRLEHELDQVRKDETNIKLSAHIRLPACFDQEIIDFIAAIVKETKVTEMELELSEGRSEEDDNDVDSTASTDNDEIGKTKKTGTFRTFGHNLSHDFKGLRSTKTLESDIDEPASESGMSVSSTFKTFGKDLGRDLKAMNAKHLRDSLKKSALNAFTNDQWIARMVGKITRGLETARGDVGYSGDLPVSLEPYRQRNAEPKLLP